MSNNIQLHKNDLPDDLKLGNVIAVDGEFMGLNVKRDPLCLIQKGRWLDNDRHVLIFQGCNRPLCLYTSLHATISRCSLQTKAQTDPSDGHLTSQFLGTKQSLVAGGFRPFTNLFAQQGLGIRVVCKLHTVHVLSCTQF